jgi:mRNA interferase MazF
VVINVKEAGRLPLRIVVPITDYDERRSALSWFVPIIPSKMNRLQKISQADCFQVKSVSLTRFETKIGDLEKESVEEIINAVAVCIGA